MCMQSTMVTRKLRAYKVIKRRCEAFPLRDDPYPGVVAHAYNPRTQEVQRDHHGFESKLGCTVSSRIAWLSYSVRPYLKNLPP